MREFPADAQEYLPILLQGVQLTVLITLASLVVSTLLGLVWAVMRVSGHSISRIWPSVSLTSGRTLVKSRNSSGSMHATST